MGKVASAHWNFAPAVLARPGYRRVDLVYTLALQDLGKKRDGRLALVRRLPPAKESNGATV